MKSIDPKSMIACRLTCHRFKPIIDDILETKQLSLWNFENSHGESKPGICHGFMERYLPMNKVFCNSEDLNTFLNDVDEHPDNPFPHRCIYFRRIQAPLPDPHGESSADWTFIEEEEEHSNHPLWPRDFDFGPKGHYQWNDPLHKFKYCSGKIRGTIKFNNIGYRI